MSVELEKFDNDELRSKLQLAFDRYYHDYLGSSVPEPELLAIEAPVAAPLELEVAPVVVDEVSVVSEVESVLVGDELVAAESEFVSADEVSLGDSELSSVDGGESFAGEFDELGETHSDEEVAVDGEGAESAASSLLSELIDDEADSVVESEGVEAEVDSELAEVPEAEGDSTEWGYSEVAEESFVEEEEVAPSYVDDYADGNDGYADDEDDDAVGFAGEEEEVGPVYGGSAQYEDDVQLEDTAQPEPQIIREIHREVIVVDSKQASDLGYGSRTGESEPVVQDRNDVADPLAAVAERVVPVAAPMKEVESSAPAVRSSDSSKKSGGLFSRLFNNKKKDEDDDLVTDETRAVFSYDYEDESESAVSSVSSSEVAVSDKGKDKVKGKGAVVDAQKLISLNTQLNYDPREERRRLQHVTSEQRDVDPEVWLERTMLDALQRDASDLHITVEGATGNLRARIRVDGQMQDFDYVTGIPARVIMGRLKAATKLSSGGSFAPEETIYELELDGEKRKARAVLFRVEDGGEALVMRLPLTGNLKQLHELSFSPANLQHVLDLLAMPYKLIMIAGPMGSGKTTTAHGGLLHVADPTRTVWTIEDPVERRLPNLVQLEIDEENGAGFDVLLGKLLRADYNTLFLGEIRDNATASAAVRQAKAGRQVMSTIHADDNVKSLMRLIDLAEDSPMSVLSAVGGVISQRLVRKLNPDWDQVDPNTKYKGRVPIHEILFVNDAIVEVMMHDRPLSDIKNAVREAKGSTFADDAHRLIEAGITDREEIVRVIGEFDREDRY